MKVTPEIAESILSGNTISEEGAEFYNLVQDDVATPAAAWDAFARAHPQEAAALLDAYQAQAQG